ncbi:MAG: hypothetical protein HOP20_10515 [Sulfuriferula sp.]|nr:hypothetical protein [Sulfuriferula sp.]
MGQDEIKKVKIKGRPKLTNPKTAADRKREQVARIKTEYETVNPQAWSKNVCLMILSNGKYNDALKKFAYRRLGVINNWVSDNDMRFLLDEDKPAALTDEKIHKPNISIRLNSPPEILC